MNQKDKAVYASFISFVVVATIVFGYLWFIEGGVPYNFKGVWHVFDYVLFISVTYVIWHPIFMKATTFVIASHIKPRVLTTGRLRKGAKVAFITTFVPASESVELLHKTLPAMVSANYSHDTWLLDEGGDKEVQSICDMYGVKYFSRHGIDEYNQPDGKFAMKTKGGNHNSWYDSFGNSYEYVAQIDTDFIPEKNFLTRTLGFFRDKKIGFVGTPQIYGNVGESIIAHGAAQQTYSFYGPLLRGMSGLESSMLIGANHVVRVAALKDVDHYSAHITEDLLTGMKLHARGWKSVYDPTPLAVGEGPITWKSYFSQQKRWAYGCMHILFNHSFRLLRQMSVRQAFYYFCIQQYYFSGVVTVIGILSLLIYFYAGIVSINMSFGIFIVAYLGMVALLGGVEFWLQKFNVRPDKEKGIMWYGILIGIAAWPIYFQAFYSLFKRTKMRYKVTPKGKKIKSKDSSLDLFVPHFIIGALALSGSVSSIFTHRSSAFMVFWSIVTGVTLLFVPFIPKIINVKKRFTEKRYDKTFDSPPSTELSIS